jgi:hypothetical protein
MRLTPAQREQFEQEGYVLIDEAVEPHLLEPLWAAADRVTWKARSGAWPDRRTVGDDDIWGINHLMHPDLGEPVFAQYLASDPVLTVAEALLGTDLRLSLLHLFVNPVERDFSIPWHRDLLHEELPPEEEAALLAGRQDCLQWNTALYDEACLRIVPGSHRRASTPAEREVWFRHPEEPMPGELAVELKAGQGIYYSEQLLHRGVYPAGQPRQTLHGCLHRHPSAEVHPFYYRSVQWLEAPGFRATLPLRLLPLYDNWLTFGEEVRRRENASVGGARNPVRSV